MGSNRLKLNVDKTQLIGLGSPPLLEAVMPSSHIVHGEAATASDTDLDLGVTLDA